MNTFVKIRNLFALGLLITLILSFASIQPAKAIPYEWWGHEIYPTSGYQYNYYDREFEGYYAYYDSSAYADYSEHYNNYYNEMDARSNCFAYACGENYTEQPLSLDANADSDATVYHNWQWIRGGGTPPGGTLKYHYGFLTGVDDQYACAYYSGDTPSGIIVTASSITQTSYSLGNDYGWPCYYNYSGFNLVAGMEPIFSLDGGGLSLEYEYYWDDIGAGEYCVSWYLDVPEQTISIDPGTYWLTMLVAVSSTATAGGNVPQYSYATGAVAGQRGQWAEAYGDFSFTPN
jgi:hypothetical protein